MLLAASGILLPLCLLVAGAATAAGVGGASIDTPLLVSRALNCIELLFLCNLFGVSNFVWHLLLLLPGGRGAPGLCSLQTDSQEVLLVIPQPLKKACEVPRGYLRPFAAYMGLFRRTAQEAELGSAPSGER